MRNIRFRGKEISTGEWIEGYFVPLHSPKYDTHDKLLGYDEIYGIFNDEPGYRSKGSYWHYIVPDTLGQFTGLCDKDNRLIYEGDIVSVKEPPFTKEGRVEYAGLVLRDLEFAVGELFVTLLFSDRYSEKNGEGLFTTRRIRYINDMGNVEVIGNIFDNSNVFSDADLGIIRQMWEQRYEME